MQEMMDLTSIILKVTGARARASVRGPLTSGMVGIPVTIEYDDAWKGLTKNLVCRCGKWGPGNGETRTILNIGESATVAHEVMRENGNLYLSIEGYSADGKLVIPTTWADCGRILPGADAGADPSADPTLAVWNQLQMEINRIRELAAGNGQNAALTAVQVNALDGMFQVCAFTKADVSAAYHAFRNAFGITGPGDTGGTEKPDAPRYTVTCELTNCESSNPAKSIGEGDSYTAELTAFEGYTLDGAAVSVVVNGEDITDTAYSGGMITIRNVLGNVVITAAAAASGGSSEVVMLKNISFDGTSYLDTQIIPESVNYRYVLGVQVPGKDIVSNKNIGGISMRDATAPANSNYWDLYWSITTKANNYHADAPKIDIVQNCMALTASLTTGQDKGDGASSQPYYDYPVYYSMDNGAQSMWLDEDGTQTPVGGYFPAVTAAVDFTNQTYYTDDEHPIESIWLGKVHVTSSVMASLATEANTYVGVKFYCFKAYDADDNIIADMRPAKQGDAVGMWDNVRDQFYPAIGTANYEEVD